MKKTTKTNVAGKETPKTLTRAEKKDATKELIKELLQSGNKKSTELIDEAAKVFAQRFQGEENENPNDVKGRIGSVLDVMKKEGEVQFDGGTYALNEKTQPKKRVSKKAEKAENKEKETTEATAKETTQETPKKRAVVKKATAVTAKETLEKAESAQETPKKRGRKPKTAEKQEEKAEKTKPVQKELVKEATVQEESKAEKQAETVDTVQEQAEEKKAEKKAENPVSPQGTLMDMSFLLGAVKPQKQEKPQEKIQEKTEAKAEIKQAETAEEKGKAQGQVSVEEVKPISKPEQKTEQKLEQKPEQKPMSKLTVKTAVKPMRMLKQRTADEKLQEAFLNRLHRLGGEYFEYYSVYLLEKYSRMNGRRLEALKITAGERDGGIDGEIELTDRLGFRETIYIQAKNWDPSKGDEKLWVVGETLLQQFIGACVCRQAKDCKQHCRGIFITTSRFTPEAKKILNDTSDKFVGYDGTDLYETAKECGFGIIKKNGEFVLDEALLSGMKAFYAMT